MISCYYFAKKRHALSLHEGMADANSMLPAFRLPEEQVDTGELHWVEADKVLQLIEAAPLMPVESEARLIGTKVAFVLCDSIGPQFHPSPLENLY
jgi:hypothetical protein